VEIASSTSKVKIDLEQWTRLKNYAPSVTEYFKTSVIPSDVDSFVQFITLSGKPHVNLGNHVALQAEEWGKLVKCFQSIDSSLKIISKLDESDVNHLIDSFLECCLPDEDPLFLIRLKMRGGGGRPYVIL
jgi:hypothetical protein